MTRFTKAAIAALIAMPLAAPAVYAQDSSTSSGSSSSQSDSSSTSGSDSSSGTSGSSSSGTSGSGSMSSDSGSGSTSGDSMSSGSGSDSMSSGSSSDAMANGSSVVVSVGDTDITADQVRQMLQAMPQQAQGQPVEVLVPIAVEELVMRELVLQEARDQGMDDSEEVRQLRDSNAPEAEIEGAIIRNYLAQELETEVTDEQAQQTYDELAQTAETELPPLEEVRPQIEQQIQQNRLMELRDELMNDTEVVYYGPDGEPREPGDSSGSMSGGSMSGGSGSSSSGDSSGSSSSSGSMSGGSSSSSDSSSGSSSN